MDAWIDSCLQVFAPGKDNRELGEELGNNWLNKLRCAKLTASKAGVTENLQRALEVSFSSLLILRKCVT